MKHFKCPPCCSSRVDLAFISTTQQTHLFLSKPFFKTPLLRLMQPDRLFQPADHIFVSFSLLGHSSQIECFLAHYYIQMPPCQNRTCQLQITTLEQLLNQQRKLHFAEVKKIEQSLDCFTRNKNKQCEEMRGVIDRLAQKLEKYKKKCCCLNDKTKQYLDTIKTLTKRTTLLEESLAALQSQKHAQKQTVLQQLKVGSELRQVITLQQTQNQQLSLKIRFLESQIHQLQVELADKAEALGRMKNADGVSQEQHQRQMTLLRQNLKLEFTRNTNDLISTLSSGHWEANTKENITSQKHTNIAEEELMTLANLMEYGASYTIFASKELSLSYSRTIMMKWKQQLTEKESLQDENQELKNIREQLVEQMKKKLEHIEEIVAMRQIKTFDIGTQTPRNEIADQLINTNSLYRIKLIQMLKLLGMSVHFTAYVLNILTYCHRKIDYLEKATHGNLKKIEKKGQNRFKAAALAVLFAQILRKKVKRQNHSSRNKELLQHSDAKWGILLSKCLSDKQNYTRRNPILDRLMNEKARTGKEDVLITFSKLVGEEAIGLALTRGVSQDLKTFDIPFY